MNISKLTLCLIVASSVSLLTVSPCNAARRYIVGVSPDLSNTERNEVCKQLLLFVLEGTSPGDRITVYDALNLTPVADLTVPEGKMFERNARARLQKMKSEVADLQKFCAQKRTVAENDEGHIYLPQFLELVGSQLRQDDSQTSVIVIGSPFYRDPREPAFNMSDGFYPSDGQITADQKVSIYGTLGKRENLKGIAVHWAYLQDHFESDEFRTRVTRFWSLFIQQQAGALCSFAGDLALVLERSRNATPAPVVTATIDSSDLKVQMHRIGRSPMRDWFQQNIPVTEPAPSPTTQGHLKIGIRWSNDVDLDLYVRPRPGAAELYYARSRTSDGVLTKDVQRSPADSRGYETVEFNSPVDLTDVIAAVNFYSGASSKGVQGVVRIEFNGALYENTFRIPATHGNGGSDYTRRQHSANWQMLDLRQIVGILR